jgi:hypothetical protein
MMMIVMVSKKIANMVKMKGMKEDIKRENLVKAKMLWSKKVKMMSL